MRKKKDVPISTFFKEQMKVNYKSIDLQNKGITVIDEISPFLSSEIETLNLKNNKLTSLKGIEQLSFLKELDVSFNKISSCRELQRLKELPNLKKMYFGNNPFLGQPIDEDILEIILQKQTDLDILSFELIKEVQNEEIKIIFLKNYLSKIRLHQQLRGNQEVSQSNNKLKTEALIDKIVPQFYSVIENPKLASSIKSQALEIKKKNNQTFEGALALSKNLKQKKIDELLGNIVQILHQTDKFSSERNFTLEVNLHNSTISFSPQKSKGFKNSLRIDQQDQFSPVKYIDFSKDENTLEDIGFSSAKAYFSKGKQGISKMPEIQQRQKAQDNIQTARKNKIQYFKHNMNIKIEDQLQGVHEKKLKIDKHMQAERQRERERQRQIKQRERERQIKQREIKESKNQAKNVNQASKNTNQYIKIVQPPAPLITDSQDNRNKTSKPSYIAFSKGESLRTPVYGQQSTVSWNNILHSPDQLTPENLETIYYKNLLKVHPMFNLLHSPSQSLKNQQKNTILQALKVSHKENFIEWLKEKITNQNLNRQLEQQRLYADQKIEQTMLLNKDIFQENVRLKEEFEWVNSRNKTLQQDYSKLYAKYKEVQASQKNKTAAMGVMQTSYKKIKETYLQKTQELQKYQTEDQKEDNITQKRQQRLKKAYFRLILKKAEAWKKFLIKSKKQQKSQNQLLIFWGFQSFKTNHNSCKSIKQFIKAKESLTLKQNFKSWVFCNGLQKKQRKLDKERSLCHMKEFFQLFRKNQAVMKMKKLKNIWATRFYKQKKYKKSLKLWVTLHNQNQSNNQKALEFYKFTYLNSYLKAIKQLMRLRKKKIEKVYQRHKDRKFEQQFKKLIYLMRKDVIVNSQKQNQVRLFYEKTCRIKNYNMFKKYAKQLKDYRYKIESARSLLLKKAWISFKRGFSFQLRKMGKLSNYCRYIYRRITKKALKREKASFDYKDKLQKLQKRKFVNLLKYNYNKEKAMRENWLKIVKQKQNKLTLFKLKFLKKLEIGRLYGRDFIKHRVIEEMGAQMNINDNQTFQIIQQQQTIIKKCEQQIIFLKKQIQMQSNRQLMLLAEKDELMLSVNESYEIILELKKEIELLKEQQKIKDEQYKALVKKYNQIVKAIQNHTSSSNRLPSPINANKST